MAGPLDWIRGIIGGSDNPEFDPADPNTWTDEQRKTFLTANRYKEIPGQAGVWASPSGAVVDGATAFAEIRDNSPNLWTPKQRTDYLGAAGYTHVQGEGPSAIWQSPTGETVSETGAFTQVQKGVDPPKAGGLTFDEQMRLKQTPSFSSSMSVRDPASLQLDRDELAEKIRQSDLQTAQWQQQMDFNRDKATVEEQRGNKQLALQAQQLAENIAARIDSSNIARQRMASDMAQFDQELAFQKQEAAAKQQESAATRAFQGQQNEADRAVQRERTALERQGKIAEFAREPGDIGAVSAMLEQGGSPISTAIGMGQSAITDRSLEPLAGLLQPQQAPAAPTPIASAMSAVPPGVTDAARWQADMAKAKALGAAHETAMAQQPAAAPAGGMTQDQINADYWRKAGVPEFAIPKAEHGGMMVGEDGMSIEQLMQMAQMMGMQPRAIAGDSSNGRPNEEVIMSNGPVAVVPKGDLPRMQTGGITDNNLIEQARQFMSTVGQRTLSRSGFGQSPTPISLADPGTSRFRQRVGAATTATTLGYPQEVFIEELLRLQPRGMQQGVYGRTR